MTDAARPAGAVLAGGASRRMGTDKARLVVDGRPLVSRVADALRAGGCEPVRVQGGDPRIARDLGLFVVDDATPGAGPLPAICSALRGAGGCDLVVAACDLPDLTAATVQRLILAAHEPSAAAVVCAVTGARAHLLSWWAGSVLDELEAVVADGVERYGCAIDRLGATRVEVDASTLHNVNSPDDLLRRRRD